MYDFLLQIPGDIENEILRKRERCSKRGITLQPFVLAVCSQDEPEECYVVIDSHKYQFDSIRKSVDICFKVFQIMNASYPVEAEQIWLLLQIQLYGIRTQYDQKSPTLISVLESFNL